MQARQIGVRKFGAAVVRFSARGELGGELGEQGVERVAIERWVAARRSAREANINIVAIHHHMTGENPRMIFLHYYGRGKALDLAQGVKAAINTQPLAANN